MRSPVGAAALGLVVALGPAAAQTSRPVGASPGDAAAVEALIAEGHWRRAHALLGPRVRVDPNDAQAAYLLSRVFQVFDDLDSARTLAERAVRLAPRNAEYHYQLSQVFGELAQRAGLLRRVGLAEHFRNEIDAALAIDSTHRGARLSLMQFYLQAPGIMGGDKRKARAIAAALLQQDSAAGYLALVNVAFAEKDTARAKLESLYLKAAAAAPHDYSTQLALAGFYLAGPAPDVAKAERPARTALGLEPRRAGAYAALSSVFAQQERWSALDSILAQAETQLPDNRGSLYQAGRILLLRGSDLPRAERYFRRYLEQEPEGGTPPLARAHWRLGLVLEKQNRVAEAVAELETALRLDPDMRDAKTDLQRLRH